MSASVQQIPKNQPAKKRVALVGGAPATEHLAPFDDRSWEVWVLGNQLDRHLSRKRRFTRVFEIHEDIAKHPANYPGALASMGVPLVVSEKFPEAGDHILVYPFEKVKPFFGSLYLTSSAAYMIGLALLEGYEEIGLFGFDMATDDEEYFYQRPCMEAWIGLARGKGVKVTIPPNCPVLKSHYVEGKACYGAGYKPSPLKPFSQADFLDLFEMHSGRIQELEAERDSLQVKIAMHEGARQAYQSMRRAARAIESGQSIERLVDMVVMK